MKAMVKSPAVKACVVMTIGLCSTFIGYEYARAASITLLAGEVIFSTALNRSIKFLS